MDSFGFIIPSYCDSELHLLQLKRCINSIRKFHKDEKIIVIDDYSEIDLTNELKGFDNLIVIMSPVKSAGDMVTYSVFKDNYLFQKAITIQDSMILEKELTNLKNVTSVNYLWYFTNHRLHWGKIKEPQTEYNIKNNIKVHDDAVLDCIKKLITKDDFKDYALNIYAKKNEWSGCFGCLTIMDYDFMLKLNKDTGIIDLLLNMNDNRLRRVAESIFALSCQYVLGDEVFEKSYDGLYYDGINPQRGKGNFKAKDLGLGNSDSPVEQVCKNDFFSKVSFNRKPINIK